jgi:hypothetical protein
MHISVLLVHFAASSESQCSSILTHYKLSLGAIQAHLCDWIKQFSAHRSVDIPRALFSLKPSSIALPKPIQPKQPTPILPTLLFF